MTIHLLDKTLQIEIFYECEDQDLEDNVCLTIVETCPPGEKILRAGETHLFLTPNEARALGEALLIAANRSDAAG
ncbi:hypothetical protein JR338_10915 [Chloroflexota bacterium]|nr:hypothetical protein JR338_10915 [Chloroflexota bacterium]